MRGKTTKLLESDIVGQAVKDAFLKLDPRVQWRNLVMFVVEIGAVLTTLIAVGDLLTGGNFKFDIQISIWLWFTVLFANFSEALAEGRGKAQAEAYGWPEARLWPTGCCTTGELSRSQHWTFARAICLW